MPTTFVFVRHAEGTHNVNNDYNNLMHKDAMLTEKGYTQINAAVSKGVPAYDSFDVVYCSPMRRCRQTLMGLYPKSKLSTVIVDDKLIEQPQGQHICNKRIEKSLMEQHVPPLWDLTFVSDENPFIFDTVADRRRIWDFTNEVKEKFKDKRVLVVTHCTWIHNWLALFKNKSDVWLQNCEFMEVSI